MRGGAQVRLVGLEAVRILLARLLVRHRRRDDDVLAGSPVRGRGDAVLRIRLQRVEQPQHFVKIASRAHRVDQHRLDLLVRSDDEDIAHRRVVVRGAGAAAARVRMDHVVRLRDLEVLAADDRIVDCRALRFLDVLRPARVIAHRVDADADDLRVALVEFGLQARHRAELRRADGGEVLRMRKQNGPGIADPVVESNLALRGVRREIRGHVTDAYRHVTLRRVACVAGATAAPRPGGSFPVSIGTDEYSAAVVRGRGHGSRATQTRAGYARDLLRAVRLAPFARDLEVRVAVRLSALPRGVVLRAARLVRLYSLRASFALARASLSVRATLPPAVGARGSSVDLRRVVGPRAACGSDGPLRALRTQRSPCFWYSCLSAANATRCARPPSPYVSTALSCAFFHRRLACGSERSIVLGISTRSLPDAVRGMGSSVVIDGTSPKRPVQPPSLRSFLSGCRAPWSPERARSALEFDGSVVDVADSAPPSRDSSPRLRRADASGDCVRSGSGVARDSPSGRDLPGCASCWRVVCSSGCG